MGTGRMEADADMARSVKYLYYTGREGGEFPCGTWERQWGEKYK